MNIFRRQKPEALTNKITKDEVALETAIKEGHDFIEKLEQEGTAYYSGRIISAMVFKAENFSGKEL